MRDTIIYGFSENFKTFDPAFYIYNQESVIISLPLDQLVRWNNDLELEPNLAMSWETPDNCKTWIFHLREGVNFHDGTPFNGSAVKYHFDRILDPATASTRRKRIADIEEIEVLDEHTVAFHMKAPNCILPDKMAETYSAIVSPTAMEQLGDNFARSPVGTGPYEFVSWDQADMRFRFKKNHDYWRADEFHIENLELRQVRENTTRLILLEQGVLDMADIAFPQVNVAKQTDDITLQSAPQLSIRYIGFNTQKPPFDDVRVRRACNYAVNKQDMIKYMFFGVGEAAIGPFPSVLPAYNPEMAKYQYNPEKAKELLAEAGYPNGFTADLWTMETGSYRSAADACVEYLRKINIDVDMTVLDNAVYWDKFDEYLLPTGEQYPTKDGVYDIYVGGWVGGEAAHGFLEPLFHSYSYSNSSFYINEEVDKLLDAYKTMPDPKDRDEVYRKLQKIIVDEAPWIFAFHGQVNVGVRKRVRGFKVNPSGRLFFEGVRVVDSESGEET